MTELLPCPFCGGKAELLTFWDFYKFSCKNADCTAHVADEPYVQHAEGVWYGSIDEARAAWNTRAECENCAALNKAAGLWAKADKRVRDLERTCSVKASYYTADVDNRGSNAEWYFAFTCGCELYWDEPEPPNYCPNCGAKVVD